MHGAEIKLDLSNHIANSNWRLGGGGGFNHHRSYKNVRRKDVQNIKMHKCILGQYCGEKYSGVFGNWEAADECFILDFRNWFDITLQKVDWPGLPLSVC